MSKFSKVAAGLAVVPMLALSAPAFADTVYGQIEGGDIYHVQNVTANGELADSTNAACGDTVLFRVVVHNVGPGDLTNVKVAATLPGDSATSHASQVSLSADNALDNAVVTATASVKTSSTTTVSYVSGSTKLLDVNNAQLKALPDGITNGGVNIGTVGATTPQTEKVSFEAKVNCPSTPPKQIQVCELATKKIVTINEKDFNSSKYSKDLSKCSETPPTSTTPQTPTTPAVLPNTGTGNVIGVVAGVVAAGTIASRLYLSRHLGRSNNR